eukprot:TRINITY_DN136_c0_g1_i1.p1 TRINITY_DN136_c0_g1~~TRINITY_DN136_c0_g1_i1.p1  ORF type:complete len:925 (-),score=367.43 TRINITY_DN136_c0_g1_i1:8-2782(-)
MPGRKKVGKERLDKFYYMAKEQGYRARSAFKLVQLNKKFDFLSRAKCVLDLCAAPGGWCQVAAKNMPKGGKIIGIDLFPIKPIPGVDTVVADITTVKCRTEIKRLIGDWKANVVLHDGAPNVGQAWNQDAFTQAELVLASLKLATEFLREGGTFVTKVFRSAEYNSLMWVFKQLFKQVEATKPEASRNQSAEIFVVCQKYLDPKKIDPKMLNPKFVFSEVAFPSKTINPLTQKEKRNRGGYEEGVVVVDKKRSAHLYIHGTNPLVDLGTYNSLTFDTDEDEGVKKHPATTTEVLALCSDLKVLGKPDFKRLLKWRLDILASEKQEEKEEEQQEEKTPEQLYQEEQEELERRVLENHRTKLKAEKKKLAREQSKKQRAIDLKITIPGLLPMDAESVELFKLKDVQDDDMLEELIDAEVPDDADFSDEELVQPVDNRSYEEVLEEWVDRVAEQKLERTLSKRKKAELAKQQSLTRRQQQILDDGQIFDDLQNKFIDVVPYVPKVDKTAEEIVNGEVEEYETESEGEEEDEMEAFQESGKVEVERPKKTGKKDKTGTKLLYSALPDEPSSKTASIWFEQFGDSIKDEDDDSQLEKLKSRLEKRRKTIQDQKRKKFESDVDEIPDVADMLDDEDEMAPQALVSQSDDEDDQDDGEDSDRDIEDEEITAIRQMQKDKDARTQKEKDQEKKKKQKKKKNSEEFDSEDDDDEEARRLKRQKRIEEETFEVVPQAEVADEEDDPMEGLTEEEKATAFAIGASIVRDPKVKEKMINDAYHRFAFNDISPTWFDIDEKTNTQRRLPLTKEVVQEMKRKQRELDARPIKKVAEAKARKKMRKQIVMNKISKEAEAIVEQEGLTPGQKAREIEKVYKRKLRRKQPKIVTVLNGKSGARNRVVTGKSGKAKTKVVDRRMKKETRSQEARAKAGKRKR